ncbi:FAD-dependent oxidoreductase [Rhodococcus sp. NPDC057014]|uniref:FAD-dependent oxidoreductase n=1 Tax=Rhodococcus sp. NPDC057014 TaxID=3346000 RepID=UPI003639241C
MPYVITQPCCNDATCLDVCPVDCIRPTPDDPSFTTTEMLYIEPDTCIECGACADACPVEAIFPAEELTEQTARYQSINANYFEAFPLESSWEGFDAPVPVTPLGEDEPLRVAIVGAGPSACYAATDLTMRLGRSVEVEMFDRLPTLWGLVRAGVAPDHPGTKNVTETFRSVLSKPPVQLHLNVEIGKHLTHEELASYHHAVIYAVGAAGDRRLDVPGEFLPGSHAATAFVAWYNGHPDYADLTFDLSSERAVIVGNGNVALDVARILVSDPDSLADTDIAEHALDALRQSNIREVVVLGRRGPAQAAYTNPELLALGHLAGVDVVIDPCELELDEHSRTVIDGGDAPATALKVAVAEEFAARSHNPANKRIVLRYLTSPTEVLGTENVTGLQVVHNDLVEDENGRLVARAGNRTETIETGLVLRSIGYRGLGVPGLPQINASGVIPNDDGRVVDKTGEPLPGVYTTGWIKRGPSGVIGTNKRCAHDTVNRLLEDLDAGRLSPTAGNHDALSELIRQRQPDVVDFRGWEAIDAAELARGAASGRSRSKITDVAAMVDIAKQR